MIKTINSRKRIILRTENKKKIFTVISLSYFAASNARFIAFGDLEQIFINI